MSGSVVTIQNEVPRLENQNSSRIGACEGPRASASGAAALERRDRKM